MALAVVVVLAVGLVVLLVVGDQVVEREAVVRGHEVDARDRSSAGVLVVVGRSGEPAGELAQRRLPAPEVTDGVAVGAVPLGPLGREVAYLVAAGPDVPRLCDQLDLAHDRVLLDELEEGREAVHLVELAGQRGREVEPEPVDVHLGHPVAQRVHDQLQRVRVPHVEGVPGARVVHVVPLVVLDEAVVGLVVDALEAERRPEVVALGGVVVDHVEDHLDAGRVHRLHHSLELLHLLSQALCIPGARGVRRLRCEEGQGVVAPVVVQSLVEQGAVLDELVHRHELEGGDAEPGQVGGDRGVRQAGVRPAQLLGHVGVQLREALDVRLVDDRLVVGDVQASVALPVEERVDHHAVRHVLRGVLVVAGLRIAEGVAEQRLVPVDLAAGRLGVGVEQQLVGVAALTLLGVPRPVHAVAVALPGLHLGEVAVPDVAVDLGQLDLGLRRAAARTDVEEAQLDAVGDLAEHGEVGPAAVERGTERIGPSGPGLHGRPPAHLLILNVKSTCPRAPRPIGSGPGDGHHGEVTGRSR